MHDDTPTTDGDAEDFEEEWESLDEKVLLVQLLAEQQRTNQLLERALSEDAAASDDTDDVEDGGETYVCTRCPATVPADGRERHARSEHRLPPGMDPRSLFEEADN